MTVALILIPAFDSLSHLVKTMPVWAVDVPEHRKPCSLPKERPFQDWLTLFTPTKGLRLNEECLNQIESIETHYPSLDRLFLIGLIGSIELKVELAKFGYDLDRNGKFLVAQKRDGRPSNEVPSS
jgi:hypothetical protein